MREVVELGLRRPQATGQTGAVPPTEASTLKGLVEAFLEVFSDLAPDAEDKDVAEFAAILQDLRAQIVEAGHDQEVRHLAASAVRACEQFLRQSRQYYATREEELADVIAMLRKTAQHLAGDSSGFDADMLATTERFKGMIQLDDIRELKRALTSEAAALQKIIETKQKRDQALVSTLTERVVTLAAHLQDVEEQAWLDPITKIPNRGRFDRSLIKMMQAARFSGTPLALVLLDIDNFKEINDTHGHPIGDRVLLCCAQWISGAIRHTDLVARYGGEEFGVILLDTDLAGAEARFRDIIAQIAGRNFEYELDGVAKSVRFTVSCGVSQLAPPDTEIDLVHRADQALYDAKRQGRNRVVSKKRSRLGGLFA
jgi:diguanylate cyclase